MQLPFDLDITILGISEMKMFVKKQLVHRYL
jgi:hypothetical protein